MEIQAECGKREKNPTVFYGEEWHYTAAGLSVEWNVGKEKDASHPWRHAYLGIKVDLNRTRYEDLVFVQGRWLLVYWCWLHCTYILGIYSRPLHDLWYICHDGTHSPEHIIREVFDVVDIFHLSVPLNWLLTRNAPPTVPAVNTTDLRRCIYEIKQIVIVPDPTQYSQHYFVFTSTNNTISFAQSTIKSIYEEHGV